MNPQSEIRTPHSATGRPRKLDEIKRREICALVSAGCPVRQAARYVRCSPSTIHREAQRDPDFQNRLRRAEMFAQLSPLRAMQQAVATHWRAAAWMLERTDPEHFARRDPRAFGASEARRLAADLLDIVDAEIHDVALRERVGKRLKAAVEYAVGLTCDTRRTNKNLQRAMKFFADKDRQADYLEQFGFPGTDLDALLRPSPPTSPARPGPPPHDRAAADSSGGGNDSQPPAPDAELSGICGSLLERFAAITASDAATQAQNPGVLQ